MLFKNVCLYRMDEPLAYAGEALEARLDEAGYTPCTRTELQSSGFAPVLDNGDPALAYLSGSGLMLRLREETKLLPASVIREAVDEQVARIEQQDGRKVRKRERDRIKDEVMFDLLPRAFSRNRSTWGYIDGPGHWLIVDAATWNRAEVFTERLRDAVRRLPIAPPRVQRSPQEVMTGWIASGRVPPDFSLGEDCVLADPNREGAEVRCKRQDLASPEIAAHLQAGKQVVRLSLLWNERLSFLLDADFSLKRIRFPDLADDERDDADETPEARFDGDFALMQLEFSGLIERLVQLFGGLVDGPGRTAPPASTDDPANLSPPAAV